MEKQKLLSEVRRGERTSLTGKMAAEDAVLRADGKVSIPWVGGGGCLVHDQEVTILDDQLQALRTTPTLAFLVGCQDRDLRFLLVSYEQANEATAPERHRNFRTTRSEYVRTHEVAANLADRLARWYEVHEEPAGVSRWKLRAEAHRSAILEAVFV